MSPEELERRLRGAGIATRPNGMMRASELQRFLGCSPRTLHAWRAAGKPPQAVRLNGSWHYSLAAVAAFHTAMTGNDRQSPAELAVDAPAASRKARGT
jgi:hypothetical protein